LKAFVRKDEAHFKPTDLHQGLDSTLNLLRRDMEERITVVKEYGEIGRVEAIPGQINQVFMSLLQNAVHAIPEKGEIRVKTSQEEDRVKISVKDNGVGISSESLKRVFEPFFTTKEVGKGMGLGLSISDRIIQNHGGEIRIASRPGGGTEVTVVLPLLQRKNDGRNGASGVKNETPAYGLGGGKSEPAI
ncbi:MAG TPA: ATP-binding protein, partial [Candidatus Manganitrophaceae bacterium]